MIAGVFKTLDAVRAEKLQVSMFLSNDQLIEEWFATVPRLLAACPDLSVIGSDNIFFVAHAVHARGSNGH